MRILHILDHSVPLHSGYSFRTIAILREQRRLGWDTVQLTGPRQEGCSVDEEQVDGFRFYRTRPLPRRLASIPLAREALEMRLLRSRIQAVARDVRPDVLHAHSPVLNAVPALAVGRSLRIPVVYEVRAFWEDAAVDHGVTQARAARYRLSRALETQALRRAAAVTTICEGLRDDIVRRGVPSERVTVIPNAVDVSKFSVDRPADPSFVKDLGVEGGPVLGFVGSFYRYEGVELLLQALPAIWSEAPDVRVLLAGGGPEDGNLRALAERMGLGERVRFLGRVPHDQVDRYYDVIDVLVYPRLHTRLTDLVTPLKPLEAMAHGRVVTASDVGGHRELIKDGLTGILFRAGDPAALAASVIRALNWPDKAAALRKEARRYVETERSWPAAVARYRQVYDAARSRRP